MTSFGKTRLVIRVKRLALSGPSRSKEVTFVAMKGRLQTVVPRYFAVATACTDGRRIPR